MIIAVKKDKKEFHINQTFASAVSEFADVLDDDRLGVLLMAYIIYVTDPAEDNIYALLPKAVREKAVAEDLKVDVKLLKDAKIRAAIRKYQLFVDENTGYKFKQAYDSGMTKIANFVNNTTELDAENAKEFSSVMKEMPLILRGRQEIEKAGSKEEVKRGQVRGKRELTEAEKSQ